MAILVYVMATVGFQGGNIFYDALLTLVASKSRLDFVSTLGYSLGYLGGGILFALTVWMTLSPQTFGLADSAAAVKVSFLCVSVWWALFSLPLFLFVKEPEREWNLSGVQMAKAHRRTLYIPAATFPERASGIAVGNGLVPWVHSDARSRIGRRK